MENSSNKNMFNNKFENKELPILHSIQQRKITEIDLKQITKPKLVRYTDNYISSVSSCNNDYNETHYKNITNLMTFGYN